VSAVPPSSNALFVVPRGQGDGFQARVRGHVLDLIDPSSYPSAPTAYDFFILSIASPLAWSAQTFLRSRRQPDYVSVSAEWRIHDDPPSLDNIDLTVTVSRRAEALRAELTAALENKLASLSLAKPALRISMQE
jgi:hypothetical protein